MDCYEKFSKPYFVLNKYIYKKKTFGLSPDDLKMRIHSTVLADDGNTKITACCDTGKDGE